MLLLLLFLLGYYVAQNIMCINQAATHLSSIATSCEQPEQLLPLDNTSVEPHASAADYRPRPPAPGLQIHH